MELRLVRVSWLGMEELGSPRCLVPSAAPHQFWVQGLCFPSQHLTSCKGRSFQHDDRSLSLAGLDRASQVGGKQAIHSRATRVEKLECCPATLKNLTSLGTAPATLPGFGLTSLGPQRER